MQSKPLDCSGCIAHLHHVGKTITQGTPKIIHIDKNPFKIGRLGCDENINKPTVSRQAAIFEIINSPNDNSSWEIKISEPAQCSVGLFVNWVHVKEQLLHDEDVIGLGLAGVLAYENSATKKLIPYGASVDHAKGIRSEFIYKFTRVPNAQRINASTASTPSPSPISRVPTQIAPQRSSSNLTPSPPQNTVTRTNSSISPPQSPFVVPTSVARASPGSPPAVNVKQEPRSSPETIGRNLSSEFSQSSQGDMFSYSSSMKFNLDAFTKLPANPCDWSVDDVVMYISEALPTQYHPETYKITFEEQGVDGEILLSLTEQDMKDDLGIAKLGVRRRLTMLIRELRKRSSALSAQGNTGEESFSATQISSEYPSSQMGTQIDALSETSSNDQSIHDTSAESITTEMKEEEKEEGNKEEEKRGEEERAETHETEQNEHTMMEEEEEEGEKEKEKEKAKQKVNVEGVQESTPGEETEDGGKESEGGEAQDKKGGEAIENVELPELATVSKEEVQQNEEEQKGREENETENATKGIERENGGEEQSTEERKEGAFKRLRKGGNEEAEEIDETQIGDTQISESQQGTQIEKEKSTQEAIESESKQEEAKDRENEDNQWREEPVGAGEGTEEGGDELQKSSKRLLEVETETEAEAKPFKRLRRAGEEGEEETKDTEERKAEEQGREKDKRKRNPFIDDEAGVDRGESSGDGEEGEEGEEREEREEGEGEEVGGEEAVEVYDSAEEEAANIAEEEETIKEGGEEITVAGEQAGEEEKEPEPKEEAEKEEKEEEEKEKEEEKEQEEEKEEEEEKEKEKEEEEHDGENQESENVEPMEVEVIDADKSEEPNETILINSDNVDVAEVLAPYLYPRPNIDTAAPVQRMRADESLNSELAVPSVFEQPEAVLPPSQEPSAMDISHIVGLANLIRKDETPAAVAEDTESIRMEPVEYKAPYVPTPAAGSAPESVISAILEQQQYTLVEEHETPEQLNTPLKLHQRQALAWMLGREKSKTHCGILADEMGLGKTMTALALILANPYKQKVSKMDINEAISQLNNNIDKTWYHLINRNRIVGKKLSEAPIEQIFPDYVSVINNRINLYSIHTKITQQKYLKRSEFLAELKTVSDNFKKYFCAKNNILYANFAAGLPAAAEAHLKMLDKEFRELEAAIDPSTLPPPKRKHPTLVVCTKSLLEQWKEEATRRTKPNTFKICIHHGPTRTKKYRDLYNYDLVISSYAIISSEFTPQRKGDTSEVEHGPVHNVKWRRVILDEAHTIKNQNARQSKACCNLQAKFRWALTGTPIQNSLEDLYSLFLFLRFSPYDDYERFRTGIVNCLTMPDLTTAFKIINTIISEVLINRTKKTMINGRPLLELPPKNVSEKRVAFSTAEQDFYNALHNYAKAQFDHYVREGTVMMHLKHIIALLTRLRQACDHPILVLASNTYQQMMKGSSVPALDLELCPICESAFEDAVEAPCRHRFCRECIEHEIAIQLKCPECKVELTSDKLRKVGSVSSGNSGISCVLPSGVKIRSSTKIDSLTSALQDQFSKEPLSKALIFSNFTSFLSLVEIRLKELNMKFVRLDGTMSLPQRKRAIENFQKFGENEHNLFLISLKAGGLGLNLIEANYVYMLDPWWNPFAEDQAIDRCHRMGQTKPVTVTKISVQGTIEDRILQLQENKRVIAEGALGRRQGLMNKKLTVDDLKTLFL